MVEELVEYHNEKNLYQLVRDFHISFKHPYNDGEPERLSVATRIDRGKWMAEEVMEYVQAGDADQIAQVDALADLLYFILGTFVAVGFDPFNDARIKDLKDFSHQLATKMYGENELSSLPADRLYLGSPQTWRTEDAERAIELVFDFLQAPTLEMQINKLRRLMDWTLAQSAVIGANLEPYFVIVHDANMSKLWADGKPRFANDGKVLKPESYAPPEKEMAALMLNELDQEQADDEIPF